MGFVAILVPPLNQVGMAADDNGIARGRPNMRFRGHNADLLFGRVVPPGCPPDVANKRLGRRRRGGGFLSHLRSVRATMSQKSSDPQAISFVSQPLKRDRAARAFTSSALSESVDACP